MVQPFGNLVFFTIFHVFVRPGFWMFFFMVLVSFLCVLGGLWEALGVKGSPREGKGREEEGGEEKGCEREAKGVKTVLLGGRAQIRGSFTGP